MNERNISIHQPNYMPWIGFFKKMAMSDVFIILDTAQYTKNGYQNRCKIKAQNKDLWLTQPVSLSKGAFQPTYKITFANEHWKTKHIKTIRTYYAKSKYFKKYFELFESFYQNDTVKLSDFNLKIIVAIKDLLGINTRIELASDFPSDLMGTDRLLELIKQFGGTTYISGIGGKSYMEENKFKDEGITLSYSKDVKNTIYSQIGDNFIPGLSILDLIFNEGPNSKEFFR